MTRNSLAARSTQSAGDRLFSILAGLVLEAFLLTTLCHAEDAPDSQPDFTQFKPEDYQRPYGPRAPWNVPLQGIPHHPDSGLWVERLWRLSTAARPGNFNLGGFESYSYPVYLAGDATASVPVMARHPDWGNLHGKEVPWNPNWKPAAGRDGQIIILDPATGREWNLWQVRFDGQTLTIGNGNLVNGDYRSKEDGFPSSRGAGIPYLAMLTRPEEIMQGAIRHALSMPAKNPNSTFFVPPATKTDGDKFGIPEGVPEGMRFGLRVTDVEIEDWIRQLPGELGETTRRSARIIARALRDYGWIITDNSGGAFFQFEHNNTAGEKWEALGLGKVKIAGKEYPQDLLDGLLTTQRMYAVVPSDQYPAAVGNRAEMTYAGDDTVFANPERGWFVFGELKPHSENINSWATDALLENYHAQGYRLAKHVVIIPTRSGPFPQSFLDDLQREADLMRKHGFKIIYRFNYNWNHDINNEDAPVAVTLSQLEQLRPFFTANTDVLFAMEMGFIGFWGEMHSSTQGHTAPKTVGLSESGQRILHKALEVFPQDRFVAVRYPQVIYRDPGQYGSLGYRKSLDEASAYNGSEQSRLAAWYANFGAGEKLYHRDAELLSQWAPETRYVPMWAHCDHFEDVTMDPREWLEMARMFHFVAISNPKDESSTRDIFDRWIKDSAYDTFARKLGYRFRLVRAELPKTLRPGSGCEVKIEMANDGFARVTNPRAVDLILRGPATYAVRLDDERGNRLWLPGPGETKTLAFTAGLPADMPPGDYEMLLNLPDPLPSLASRPDYAVRLANDKVWEAGSGFNRLLHTIQIDPNADGQRYQGPLQFAPVATGPKEPAEPLRAFPGAVGFGAKARGGRGGMVVFVENLYDSGPGSLRAALETDGPRTVIFRTSGTIELKSEITVRHPFLTVAGQTAPGGGIALKIDGNSDIGALRIETHDVIVRHLRVRPGPGAPGVNGDAIEMLQNARDVIIDHCSLSWGTDEVISGWYNACDITVQHCIISEALHESVHQKGSHGMGMLFGDENKNVTIHRNLFAHNNQRNPLLNPDGKGKFQINNNVIYDWGQIASEVINEADVNLTGNFYKIGPSSRPERGVSVDGKVKVYPQGNISPIRPDSSLPEDAILKPWGKTDRSAFAVTTPFAAPTLPVLADVENYKAVLADAGATRPKLDSVDQRILADVKNGTGKIINHPSEVGGWPTLTAGDLPDDRDNDGIPDIWEKAHGLNPDDAEDRNGSSQPEGYTHLEEYLNDID